MKSILVRCVLFFSLSTAWGASEMDPRPELDHPFGRMIYEEVSEEIAASSCFEEEEKRFDSFKGVVWLFWDSALRSGILQYDQPYPLMTASLNALHSMCRRVFLRHLDGSIKTVQTIVHMPPGLEDLGSFTELCLAPLDWKNIDSDLYGITYLIEAEDGGVYVFSLKFASDPKTDMLAPTALWFGSIQNSFIEERVKKIADLVRSGPGIPLAVQLPFP